MLTRLTGGTIYDPANGVDGEVRDLYVRDGRIVAPPLDGETIAHEHDLSGRVVMAGAIDIHTHIGGGKMTLARMLLPEDHADHPVPRTRTTRSGSGYIVPSTFATGYRYAEMGYTACFEPAMLPSNARQAHMEMADTPIVDKGAYVMLGSDDFLLRLMAEQAEQAIVNDYVAWTLESAQALAIKVVNPGGISAFKFNQRALDLDEAHPYYPNVTPRAVVEVLTRAVHELGVPHPLHVHGCNLGVPGNVATTEKTVGAARRPAPAPDPRPVPQLRHGGRPGFLVGGGAYRRGAQRPSESIDRRRPAHVRPDGHGLGRHHGPVPQPQERPPQEMGVHGHRVRCRLRDRALPLQAQGLRQRVAMGHRSGAVPAGPRPLAGVPDDRPSERGAVRDLPASDPAPHGPRIPQR